PPQPDGTIRPLRGLSALRPLAAGWRGGVVCTRWPFGGSRGRRGVRQLLRGVAAGRAQLRETERLWFPRCQWQLARQRDHVRNRFQGPRLIRPPDRLAVAA